MPPQKIFSIVKEFTDSEIIQSLRSRDSSVIYFLTDRYLPMIRLMVMNMGGSAEDAKDIFQEGLMIILEKTDSRDFALSCKFKTFLYCICENLCKTIMIRRRRASLYLVRKEVTDDTEDFSENSDKNIYREIFYQAFDELEPAVQSILKLYWEDYSPREIADKLGVSYGYVTKTKSEATAVLTGKIREHPDYKKIKDER